MRLTPHFDTDEAGQPARHGFKAVPYPEEWRDSRLLLLFTDLEVVREACGNRAVILNNVYRTREYNTYIGGARNSQHMQGRAADIVVRGLDPSVVQKIVMRLYDEGRLRYIRGLGRYPTFTHVDVRVDKDGRIPNRLATWSGSRSEN